MQNQDLTPQQERKLRFFEAGILFALVLGIAVFVGLKTGDGQDEPVVAATVTTVPEVEIGIAEGTDPAAGPAAADVADAVEAEPEPVVVTYAMAEQAYFDRDYAGAADLFGRYTDDHPANAWGFYMLGLSAWKAGDAAGADEALAYAVELAPQHVKSLVNHGRVLLDLGRPDDAEARLAAALDLDPAYADAHRVMGRIRHHQSRPDDAIASYEDALRLDGGDVWSLNNLGLILIEQERSAEALAALAQAASLDSGLACVQNNLGVALELTGHYTAAADAYARALDADPAYAKAEQSRTRVLALTENPDTAPLDLAALAASFSVSPRSTDSLAAAEAGTEPQSPDMEVAAAVPTTGDGGAAAPQQPEATPVPQSQEDVPDGERNR